MCLTYSWYLCFKLLPVCPTYERLHAQRVSIPYARQVSLVLEYRVWYSRYEMRRLYLCV
jgi:hypothetical protein